MSPSASAQHRSRSKNESVEGLPSPVSEATASEPLSDPGGPLTPYAASADHSPSARTHSKGDGVELSTNATPSADAARLQRHQSSDIQLTERQLPVVPSTNEAPGPRANPNARYTPSIKEHQLTREEQPKVDQPEPSTTVSAAPVPPRAPMSKRLSESFDYRTGWGVLRCLLMLFILSVGIGVAVYECFMHFGAPTAFNPGDIRKGFADPPNTRGAFDIITACFATILTCVYGALHLDVTYTREGDVEKREGDIVKDEKGEPSDEERNSRQQEVERGEGTAHGQEPRWRRWAKKVSGWAKKDTKGMSRWPRKLWIKIQSMKHRAVWVVFNIVAPELVAYVAVVEIVTARNKRRAIVRLLGCNLNMWTLKHQHMANMGGFKVPSIEGGYVILRSGYDFHQWTKENLEAFKSIDFKQVGIDIENCSKADGLLKAYTVIQASWLVVQTIERVNKGLPVTELEVTTCAYVACAIFTYACWWNKPYGVQKHILLHVRPTPRPDWIQDTDPTPFNRTYRDIHVGLELPAVVFSGIIGAVVGAIHCTLWNAQFANTNGQLLWRICCIIQTVAPILMSVFLVFPSLKGWNNVYEKWDKRSLLFALIPCFFQFCARIIIFILIGYSFWSQPADVYVEADWSWSWFPHIS